jgi:hypothetical protein
MFHSYQAQQNISGSRTKNSSSSSQSRTGPQGDGATRSHRRTASGTAAPSPTDRTAPASLHVDTGPSSRHGHGDRPQQQQHQHWSSFSEGMNCEKTSPTNSLALHAQQHYAASVAAYNSAIVQNSEPRQQQQQQQPYPPWDALTLEQQQQCIQHYAYYQLQQLQQQPQGGYPQDPYQQHQSYPAQKQPQQQKNNNKTQGHEIGKDAYAALLQGTGTFSGYGATGSSSSRPATTPKSAKIWTAGTLSSSASNENLQNFVAPPPSLPRTQEQHPRRSASDKMHRRSHSDSVRRAWVGDSNAYQSRGRPSMPTDPLRARKRLGGGDGTPRRSDFSFASQSSFFGAGSPAGSRAPSHRRGSSVASLRSEASMVSVVSDIRRSAFYGGIEESTGRVKMHYPLENVHLVPVLKESDLNSSSRVFRGVDPRAEADELDAAGDEYYPLRVGRLYKVNICNEEYEHYHLVASGENMSWSLDDDDDDNNDGGMYNDFAGSGKKKCRCACANCATCEHRPSVLPPNYFCLAVDDDLYSRVLDEICESQQMPCGLYFCGHHEDVARPSIFIAVTALTLLFVVMGSVAFLANA